MRTASKDITKKVHDEIVGRLCQVVSDINKPDEIATFLKALLSEAEIVALAKKLEIAFLLNKGASYPTIKEKLQVSSSTIAQVSELKATAGFVIASEKWQTDEWADNWEKKIRGLFR